MKKWYNIYTESNGIRPSPDHDDIIEHLRDDNFEAFIAVDFTGCCNDKVHWPFMEEEIAMFSKQYPDVTFIVEYDGNEYHVKNGEELTPV